MSAIAATNASPYGAMASLRDSALSSSTVVSPRANGGKAPDAKTTTSNEPVDTIDLSDRAKQILARAESEQEAADKLTALLQSLKDPDDKSSISERKADDGTRAFEKLSGRNQRSASETTWTAGSKWGDPTISDAEFVERYKDALMGGLTGYPPEKQAALQAAIANGTLKIQKGSDVPGYNTRTVVTYNVGPGGGQGMSTFGYAPPTGAAKEAIQAGTAYGFWTADRGDVYVSW
jgi:hypothetical protein